MCLRRRYLMRPPPSLFRNIWMTPRRLTYTSLFSFSPGSTCPFPYSNDVGDVPGWGSIKSLPSISNIESCARHCSTTPFRCCSFEYSPTRRKCNLNTECRPTTTAVFGDYAFCVKGNSNTCTFFDAPNCFFIYVFLLVDCSTQL